MLLQKCTAVWLACALLTGCWDSQEIDELSIILGVAIDKDNNMISLTYQHLVARESKRNMYVNVTTTSPESIQMTSREQTKQVARAPLFNFIRLILISDEAIKQNQINQLLDHYMRTYKVSRKSVIMIVRGRAKEALDKLGKHQELPSIGLEALADNSMVNSKILRKTTLGDLSKHISQNVDFMIPKLDINDSNILSGAAVIRGKTKKFAGWLEEDDVVGINWMLGKTKGNILKANEPETEKTLVFEVDKVKSKIIPRLQGQELSFLVRIKTDLRVSETLDLTSDLLKEPFIRSAKEAAQEAIISKARHSLNILKKEMKVDVLGFGAKLKVKYPDYWDRVEKNWQDTFSEVPIEVQVKAEIKRSGAYTKGESS
ncbi:Ger(x)C family spore germination protein [Paenibacillus puldeungensis]|uniref:Ger(X)C family spore germination protein n=1 Tax=Paenibacillus puldeungensis TaxID=696536 RepID=A0ABW3S081_9BACL